MDGDAEHQRDDRPALSNAEIADRLASVAQLLSAQKENPYKVKAYRRAAERIRNFSEGLDEMVREDSDLTRFAGIGSAIASAIREIVMTGRSANSNGCVARRHLLCPASAPIPASIPTGSC